MSWMFVLGRLAERDSIPPVAAPRLVLLSSFVLGLKPEAIACRRSATIHRMMVTNTQGALATLGFDVEPRCGSLPHREQPGATYFVTYRTADSGPRATFDSWKRERADALLRLGIDVNRTD